MTGGVKFGELSVSCATCLCYAPVARDAGEPMGTCHRNPPTAVIGPANRVAVPGQAGMMGTAGLWPPVKPGDWCAQYAPHPDYAPGSAATAN